ncbi:MAG: DNA mismatch repair protein MutS, partial [Oscillospiraceae bacterium]|nr:DNA mismatch repair protein MutS [Oscillospiraceae bacterium]
GDFYEMFFDDAILASRELELQLTGKNCGMDERAKMCGVPHHSCESYIARLIEKGYKVAICEQLEDPSKSKGLVKRDVVRVVTPGTVVEGSMLDESKNNYICAIKLEFNGAGIVFADVSTGEIKATSFSDGDIVVKVVNELSRFSPREVLLCPNSSNDGNITQFVKNRLAAAVTVMSNEVLDLKYAKQTVLSQFKASSLSELKIEAYPLVTQALGGLFDYLQETQISGLSRLDRIELYKTEQFMNLDITARQNLELTRSMHKGEKYGTLLWVLDQTETAMGQRLLRNYIEQPLMSLSDITRRQNAVSELFDNSVMREEIREKLRNIYDLKRILTRVVFGNVSPRELNSLAYTAEQIPPIINSLCSASGALLRELLGSIDPLYDIHDMIVSTIADEPAAILRDGGYIREGFNSDLDTLRDILNNNKTFLAKIESSEKERTGIRTLKVGYNKVFGYYIEVSKSFVDQVPEEYIRKQTLTGGERYITQELKEIEAKMLTAGERSIALEYELFGELRNKVASQLDRIQRTAEALSVLDVMCSFAHVAVTNNYVCPSLNVSGELYIKEGRHPVVEQLTMTPFVPNDTNLDTNDNAIAIITGPNMAGKSTYMRQVALINIMAQIGSFVPAKDANISIVDSVFTRIGASDDLASGQSTFMMEMNEVSYILKNATKNSLLVLDEVGRGTSTFDGMSIARAVLEYIANKKKLGAKTLFATHYHELSVLEDKLSNVKNYNIMVKKRGEEIIFLRRIVRGGTDDSYGIDVARLSGIPSEIISRAKEILKSLEQGKEIEFKGNVTPEVISSTDSYQISFDTSNNLPIVDKIRAIDVDVLTPREAINILFELKKMAEDE